MSCKAKQKILISFMAVIFLICPALSGHVSYSQDKVKGEWLLPKHYPDGFDGWGKINRINTEEIVIDDVQFALHSNVSYYTPTSPSAMPFSWLKQGKTVGFIKNSSNEIASLWLIDF